MFTYIIQYQVSAEKQAKFLEIADKILTTTRQHDRVLEITLLQNEADPTQYVLFERWEDQAALDAHTARLRAWRAAGGEEAAPHLTPYADHGQRGTYRVVV